MLRGRSGLPEAQGQRTPSRTVTAMPRRTSRTGRHRRGPTPKLRLGSSAGGRGAGWGGRGRGAGGSGQRGGRRGPRSPVGAEADDDDGDELARALNRSLDSRSPRRCASPAVTPSTTTEQTAEQLVEAMMAMREAEAAAAGRAEGPQGPRTPPPGGEARRARIHAGADGWAETQLALLRLRRGAGANRGGAGSDHGAARRGLGPTRGRRSRSRRRRRRPWGLRGGRPWPRGTTRAWLTPRASARQMLRRMLHWRYPF